MSCTARSSRQVSVPVPVPVPVHLQNNPLLLRAFEPTDDLLKLHYVVHCSLDAVEEKREWQLGCNSMLLGPRRAPGAVACFLPPPPDAYRLACLRAVLLKRGPGDALDLYLGLLYPTQDMHKVYG